MDIERPTCSRGSRRCSDRRPDRASQPARLGGGAPARDGARPSFRAPALCRDARPRLLQGLQRRARTPGRGTGSSSRAPAAWGEELRASDIAGPLRRRGVHRRAARVHLVNARDDRRAPPLRDACRANRLGGGSRAGTGASRPKSSSAVPTRRCTRPSAAAETGSSPPVGCSRASCTRSASRLVRHPILHI